MNEESLRRTEQFMNDVVKYHQNYQDWMIIVKEYLFNNPERLDYYYDEASKLSIKDSKRRLADKLIEEIGENIIKTPSNMPVENLITLGICVDLFEKMRKINNMVNKKNKFYKRV